MSVTPLANRPSDDSGHAESSAAPVISLEQRVSDRAEEDRWLLRPHRLRHDDAELVLPVTPGPFAPDALLQAQMPALSLRLAALPDGAATNGDAPPVAPGPGESSPVTPGFVGMSAVTSTLSTSVASQVAARVAVTADASGGSTAVLRPARVLPPLAATPAVAPTSGTSVVAAMPEAGPLPPLPVAVLREHREDGGSPRRSGSREPATSELLSGASAGRPMSLPATPPAAPSVSTPAPAPPPPTLVPLPQLPIAPPPGSFTYDFTTWTGDLHTVSGTLHGSVAALVSDSARVVEALSVAAPALKDIQVSVGSGQGRADEDGHSRRHEDHEGEDA